MWKCWQLLSSEVKGPLLWPGLNVRANKSWLKEPNSNLLIAHPRHCLHLIGCEEEQPYWSQDCGTETSGNCYKILIYVIFQTKGDSRESWPLSAETLVTHQQWGYIFNTKMNDKIREMALQLYCLETGRFVRGLSKFVGYINWNNMKKQRLKNADVVAIDFKQRCGKQQFIVDASVISS